MRLIYADKITTETFKAYVGENGGFISFGDAVDAIEAIPTAYDVDKVVEELRRRKAKYIANDDKLSEGRYDGLSQALDVVKRGGIE